MADRLDALVIGAGPFGLALGAYLRRLGLDHQVCGRPMEFWRTHMPSDMLLRSDCDWHLDPLGEHTIDAFLSTRGLSRGDVEPLSRNFYLDYAAWFQDASGVETDPRYVARLDRDNGTFRATLEDGDDVEARHVALAIGMGAFPRVPPDVAEVLPPGRWSHSMDFVDFAPWRGRRLLIIGGRQSAYEWAALANDHEVAAVHIVHRHDPPRYAEADWSWVGPMVARYLDEPGWYHALPEDGRAEIGQRLWAEGRLKVEPWLEDRVVGNATTVWPGTTVAACRVGDDDALDVTLSSGDAVRVDHVICATGYQVDMQRVGFLQAGNLRDAVPLDEGSPVLDEHFQTGVPRLYVTSFAAARAFGPFFGFTIAVPVQARLIGDHIAGR